MVKVYLISQLVLALTLLPFTTSHNTRFIEFALKPNPKSVRDWIGIIICPGMYLSLSLVLAWRKWRKRGKST